MREQRYTEEQERFMGRLSEILSQDKALLSRFRQAFTDEYSARQNTKTRCPNCGKWVEMGMTCGCALAG